MSQGMAGTALLAKVETWGLSASIIVKERLRTMLSSIVIAETVLVVLWSG